MTTANAHAISVSRRYQANGVTIPLCASRTPSKWVLLREAMQAVTSMIAQPIAKAFHPAMYLYGLNRLVVLNGVVVVMCFLFIGVYLVDFSGDGFSLSPIRAIISSSRLRTVG